MWRNSRALTVVTNFVGVASGSDKAEAIFAALRCGLLHYFVTDTETAKAVLAMKE